MHAHLRHAETMKLNTYNSPGRHVVFKRNTGQVQTALGLQQLCTFGGNQREKAAGALAACASASLKRYYCCCTRAMSNLG